MPRTALPMPKMSMTMETGELTAWLVDVGDQVVAGQVVCEVMTDKVEMEVESPVSGTVVRLDAPVGSTVPVGEPMAWLETESASLIGDLLAPAPEDGRPAASPAASAAPPPAAPPPDDPALDYPALDRPALDRPPHGRASSIVPAIPAARQLAVQSGVPLDTVTGSGPGGAVLLRDVQTVLERRTATADVTSQARSEPSTPAGTEPLSWLPEPVGAIIARDEAVLGAGEASSPPDPHATLARLAAALASALAAEAEGALRATAPRVGLMLPSPRGPVSLTIAGAHLLSPAELRSTVARAVRQAAAGQVDVDFLVPPHATLTHVGEVDQVDVPCRPELLVAVGAGSARPRVVASDRGLGVRVTVQLSATTHRLTAPHVAALLARMAAGIRDHIAS